MMRIIGFSLTKIFFLFLYYIMPSTTRVSASRCQPCKPCSSPSSSSCNPTPCPKPVCKKVVCQPCVDKCNPCVRPYTVTCTNGCDCEVVDICVSADPCLLQDSVLKSYFCCVKESIIYNRLDTMLAAVVDTTTYNALLAAANVLASKITDGRVVITLPDGTVVIDTFQGATNTYANYQAKSINENHGSRIAIHHSLSHQNGVGWERKLSTTTETVQNYVAVRLGEYLRHIGSVRLSADYVPVV